MNRSVRDDFTLEELVAFADDEIGEPKRSQIAVALSQDEVLAMQVAAFRSSAQMLRATHPPLVDPDSDRKIIAAMQAAIESEGESANVTSTVVPFRQRYVIPGGWWPSAAAAALVLGVGLTSGYLIGNQNGKEPASGSGVAADIASALDTLASGNVLRREGGQATIIATFEARNGDTCREYEVAQESAGILLVLACKTDGTWRSVAQFVTEENQNSFALAGVTGYVDALVRDGELKGPLTESEEKARLGIGQ